MSIAFIKLWDLWPAHLCVENYSCFLLALSSADVLVRISCGYRVRLAGTQCPHLYIAWLDVHISLILSPFSYLISIFLFFLFSFLLPLPLGVTSVDHPAPLISHIISVCMSSLTTSITLLLVFLFSSRWSRSRQRGWELLQGLKLTAIEKPLTAEHNFCMNLL